MKRRLSAQRKMLLGQLCDMQLQYANVANQLPASLRRTRTACRRQTATSRRSTQCDQVHIATVPLVGWEYAETTLRSAFPQALALHCMVVVHPVSPVLESVTVFDFLPQSPASPATAAKLLAGGVVPGQLRERHLSRMPSRRCWHIAEACEPEVAFRLTGMRSCKQVQSCESAAGCRVRTQAELELQYAATAGSE